MANEKAWYILWFCRTSGTVSPSLCAVWTLYLITLITYQFSLLLLLEDFLEGEPKKKKFFVVVKK